MIGRLRGGVRAPRWLVLIALATGGCVLGPSPDLPGGVPMPPDEALGSGSGGNTSSAGTGGAGTGGTAAGGTGGSDSGAGGGSGGCTDNPACATDCSGSGGSTGGAPGCPGVGGSGGEPTELP